MATDYVKLLRYCEQWLRKVRAGKDIPDEARDKLLELGLIDYKHGASGLRVRHAGELIIAAGDTVAAYMERADSESDAS